MNTKLILVSVFLLFIVVSCGKGDKTYTVEIKDGVKYIHNKAPLWGSEPKVALEFVQKIGDIETEDEDYLLYRPLDVTRDKYGNIYILDRGRFCVRKYNADGGFIMDMGKEGQGPGEFLSSIRMDSDPEGNIFVTDLGNSRIQIFTSEGKHKDSYILQSFFHFFCVQSSGTVIGSANRDISVDSKLLRKLDAEGNLLKKFGKPFSSGDHLLLLMVNNVSIENDDADNIYITFDYQNRIDKYSPDGELLMSIDRPLNFEVKHEMKMSRIKYGSEEREYPDPQMTIVSLGIGVDNKERIWVVTFNKQPESIGSASSTVEDYTRMDLEIFDRDGILLGRLPVPVPFYNMCVSGDRLLLLDPYQNVCVNEYKIVEK